MTDQEILDFVRKAMNEKSVYFNRSRTAGGNDPFINVILGDTELEGEDGYWGIGGQRRGVTTVEVEVFDKVVEGNKRPYQQATARARQIGDKISAASDARVIHHWIENVEVAGDDDEPEQTQTITATITVMIRHTIASGVVN